MVFTKEKALMRLEALKLPDRQNFLYARTTGSRLQHLIWDITSNPALFGDIFERQVLLIFTPTTLYVQALTGKERTQTMAVDAISDFKLIKTLTEWRLDFRFQDKAYHYKFFADKKGPYAYTGENFANLQAKHWFNLA